MKAEIYYLENQEELIAGLADDLRAELHPTLEVELRLIVFSNRRQIVDMGRRYIKLLQASIRPETGLQIGIKELDHYGYRFYNYVYYAFTFSNGGSVQLQDFFPAVAVRNRMALVPAGLGRSLGRKPSDTLSSMFKPLEKGGVAEVDFRDLPAVEAALAKVAQTTRADLLQEIGAYARRSGPGGLDLPALAQAIEIDIGFLEGLLAGGARERGFYSQLKCEITPENLTFGRWTKVNLSVRNDSQVSLTGLVAKISGKVEILPSRIQLDVPAQETASVPISLKPTERGEFPLEVVFVLPDDQFFSSWLEAQHPWLKCD